MSAAEKLKALDGKFDWHESETTSGEKYRIVPAALVDALPQIVAVVEAAQTERTHHADYWDSRMDCPTCRALAALDEALS